MAISYTKQGEISFADLAALREELKEQRRALDEQERALDLVEQMLKAKSSGPRFSVRISPAAQQVPQPGGFTEAVRIVTGQFGEREFTVQDIEEMLRMLDFPIPEVDPRSRIAMVVKQLADEGAIVRTFEGSGRTPHRYKAKK